MSKPWLKWPRRLLDADKCEVFKHLSTNACLAPVLRDVRTKFFSRATQLMKPGFAVLMQGATETPVFDADCDREFVQEPYFKYLFGVDEPDITGVVDLEKKEFLLFVPKFPVEYQRVMGPPRKFEWYESRFDVKVYYMEELKSQLEARAVTALHIMSPTPDSDSKIPYPLIPSAELLQGLPTDDSLLHKILTECRVQKTPGELQLLKWANEANSRAHCFIQLHCRPGMLERQLEALFRGHLGYAAGNRGYLHYGAIVAGGARSATLHYGHAAAANDEELLDGDLVLVDMGGLFQGYGADITHTYPVNGKFTDKQKLIYEAVLAAHDAVLRKMAPGVNWLECHKLAEKVILQHLIAGGVLKGDEAELDEMIDAGLGAVFMPHGLGHFLGMRTHDVGGFTEQFKRATRVGLNYCRTSRDLLEGMYITLEPGCYFIDYLLDNAMKEDSPLAQWIVKDRVNEFRNFGGVRIESNVAVTHDAAESYSIVPRTVEDIEEFMALAHEEDEPSAKRAKMHE
eukprot:GDKJ01016298.1.p1 GENE.GDKJ01016298.1~~GDKJ01016298.1.p1  ORF type:complete len:513 (+),score=115.88 GDKJ01016298.1:30-1568(+)